MKIEDCRVVITGAARDMGRTFGICFAQLGAEVFLSGRDIGAVKVVRDDLVNRGHGRVHAHQCDLRDPESVKRFAGDVNDKVDAVDILINNGAGCVKGRTRKSGTVTFTPIASDGYPCNIALPARF